MTAEPANESSKKALSAATESARVLVVTDPEMPLERLTKVLECEYGVETTVVHSTVDVPDRLETFDCVIGGPDLVETAGLAVLSGVREVRPDVPIVSFYTEKATAARTLDVGIDHCIRYDDRQTATQAAHVAVVLRQELKRRRTVRGLEDEVTFVRGALDALEDVFFVFNLDMEFVHWNERLTAVTDYTDAEVATMAPTDFVATEDIEPIASAIGRAVENGRAKEEAAIVTKSGERIPYELTGALLEDENGTMLGICGIGRDITDRKRRERVLEYQAERLRTTNRINEIIRDVNQALVRAGTREEIERAVCENLASEEGYRFAWIGEARVAGEGVAPREWAGVEEGYLDDRPGVGESNGVTAETAIDTGEMHVAQSIAEDPAFESWREAALSRGFESAVAIPLSYRETDYGVLCVYSPRSNAFDETERDVLGELGETIAYAFSAAERRRALVSDTVVELEFALHDRSIFTVDLTARTDCRVTLDGIVERSDGTLVEFVTVSGIDSTTVLDLAADREDIDASLVSEHDGENVFQLVSTETSSTVSLADMGGVIREGSTEAGEGRLVFELPQEADVRTIVEAMTDQYDDTELVAQRERERTSTRGTEFRAALDDALTDRQKEVLKTAYLSGFFEWPRETKGDEIAASLDIAGPTFHEHIRTGQRKLLDAFFESEAANDS